MKPASFQFQEAKVKLHLNLKQTKIKDKLTQIMLATTLDRRRIRLYTRLRVEPMYWDNRSGRCRTTHICSTRVANRLKYINNRIDEMMNSIDETDRKLASRGERLNRNSLKLTLMPRRAAVVAADTKPIERLKMLAQNYDTAANKNGQQGNDSTRVAYRTALRRLESFDRQRETPIVSFDQFDREFFDEFASFLNRQTYGKQRKHYTRNTIVNTLKVVKNMLRRAYDCDMTSNNSFLKIQTALPANASEHVYLHEKDIRKIAAAQTVSIGERNVRDMFVIACYTALRISDIQQLCNAVIADGRISLYQKKTKDLVEIPILKEIASLVERYKRSGFPTIDPSRANRIIRSLAQRCGIDDIVCCKEQRGGQTIITNKRKYELISFHTARRSCITNLYKRGYPANYVMLLSGHKSIQAFQRYVRASNSEMMESFVNMLRKENAIAK